MHVNVLRNDQSVYTREQAFGGNQLTQDISARFGMSPEEAENAKRTGGLPDELRDRGAAARSWRTLALEISARCSSSSPRPSTTQVDHILLAGGSRGDPGLDEVVHTRTQVPTIVANPFAHDADLAAHPAQAPDARRALADRRLRPGDAEVRPVMTSASTCCRTARSGASARSSSSSSLGGIAAGRRGARRRRLVHGYSPRRSTTRTTATRFLKTEIAKLDKQIEEIDKLQRRDRGAARAQAGRRDAAGRPRETVHLLDQLVRQLPDGVYLQVDQADGP